MDDKNILNYIFLPASIHPHNFLVREEMIGTYFETAHEISMPKTFRYFLNTLC